MEICLNHAVNTDYETNIIYRVQSVLEYTVFMYNASIDVGILTVFKYSHTSSYVIKTNKIINAV